MYPNEPLLNIQIGQIINGFEIKRSKPFTELRKRARSWHVRSFLFLGSSRTGTIKSSVSYLKTNGAWTQPDCQW